MHNVHILLKTLKESLQDQSINNMHLTNMGIQIRKLFSLNMHQ